MSIKIIQIGNNLNIVFNEKRFTINVNEIDKEKLYKLSSSFSILIELFVANSLALLVSLKLNSRINPSFFNFIFPLKLVLILLYSL